MTEPTNSLENDREALLPERLADEAPENAPAFKIGDLGGYLLISAGVVMAIWYFAYRPLVRANATANWPRTTGTITKSSYSTTQTVRPSITRCRPEVEYSYCIPSEQRTFTSRQVSANGLILTSKRDAEAFLAQRQPGMTVPVYYNRETPSDAVLVTGITRHDSVMHWIVYFGIDAVVTAVLLILFYAYGLVAALFGKGPHKVSYSLLKL